ncbi:unnamed protein product [Mytilus coruscus]|uniref:VWFA domain-containing protein n=1 Tax=Mytilus coruscus TaxID=42192 RepID=A0A6J8AB44_MYTCO|nr:unnamed protein product [Mytilus coruscus]
MRENSKGMDYEEGGEWARSVFQVFDDLVKHDVSSNYQLFAIDVGCCSDETFDIFKTVKQFQDRGPNTNASYNEMLEKLFTVPETGGAHTIRKWADPAVIKSTVTQDMINLMLAEHQSNASVEDVYTVHESSDIVHGYVAEKRLTDERLDELMKIVEPFIYGKTPLYASIEKAAKLFLREKYSEHKKFLFVLSDGDPTAEGGLVEALSRFKNLNITIVTRFITRSNDVTPLTLFSVGNSCWDNGAKFVFQLSSMMPTDRLYRSIFVKRGRNIDITNNETRLFLQVNHPDNIHDACDLEKKSFEKAHYKEHGKQIAHQLIGRYIDLQKAKYKCPLFDLGAGVFDLFVGDEGVDEPAVELVEDVDAIVVIFFCAAPSVVAEDAVPLLEALIETVTTFFLEVLDSTKAIKKRQNIYYMHVLNMIKKELLPAPDPLTVRVVLPTPSPHTETPTVPTPSPQEIKGEIPTLSLFTGVSKSTTLKPTSVLMPSKSVHTSIDGNNNLLSTTLRPTTVGVHSKTTVHTSINGNNKLSLTTFRPTTVRMPGKTVHTSIDGNNKLSSTTLRPEFCFLSR